MIPTIPVTELTDTELDEVSGGVSTIIASAVNQQNFLSQFGVAVSAVTAGSPATVVQTAVQANSIS